MRFMLLLLLAGCCPFQEPGELRVVGSSIGNGTAYHPQWIMLYDPKTDSFYEVDRKYWESFRASGRSAAGGRD